MTPSEKTLKGIVAKIVNVRIRMTTVYSELSRTRWSALCQLCLDIIPRDGPFNFRNMKAAVVLIENDGLIGDIHSKDLI